MATTEEQKILDIKVRYEDALYGIIRYKEKIDELKASLATLKEQEKDGTITRNEYKVQTEAINVQMTQYKDTMRVLRKEMQNNLRQEQFQEGSLKQLRAELSNATKAYDELSKAERNSAKGKEMQEHINKITNELKLAEEQTQRYYRSVGSYYNSMLDLAEDLQHVTPMGGGGGVGEFTNSVVTLGKNLEGLKGKVLAFSKTLLGLAANPVFLALAGITGAGMAFKWFYDYNKGLLEATRLTREFTGYTGDALESLRNSISATADLYGKDFKEVLSTVDVLMQQYGYDGEKSMKIINDGFSSGADLSGEMLSMIQQYAPAFNDAGIAGDELVAIIQQTRSGLFGKDGMDAIMKASKSLRNMSSTTASALDAIGVSSDTLKKKLESGQITMLDAIQQISGKLKELPANTQEVGTVIDNVFGKKGTAAGQKQIQALADLETSLDKVKESAGGYAKIQEENQKLQRELNDYTSMFFDQSQNGFGTIIAQGKQFGTRVLITILKGLQSAINYFVDWYNDSLLLRTAINSVGVQFRVLWATVKLVVNLVIDAFKKMALQAKGMADILEGIFTFDVDKAKQGFKEMFDVTGILKEAWGDLKKFGKESAQSVIDGYNAVMGSAKLEHINTASPYNGGTDGSNSTGGSTPSKNKNNGTDGKSSKNKTKKEIDAEKLEAERKKKQERKLQEDIALIQYQYNVKVMDAKKMFLAGMYEKDRDYDTELESLEKDMIARSLDAYVAAGKIGEQKAQEMQGKLLDIMIKAKEQLKQNAKETIEDLNKEFEKGEKLRIETEVKGGGTGEESDDSLKLQRYQAFLQSKLALYQNDAEVQKQLQQEIHDNEIALQQDAKKKEIEEEEKKKEKFKAIYQQIADGLASAMDEMFEAETAKGKAFLKSMLITALDMLKPYILAELQVKQIASKGIWGIAEAAVLTGIVEATFAGAKAAIKGFATGGLVEGEGTGTSDSIPARLSNGESVMTARATSMFSPILSAFNQLGGGVPIVVNGGGSQIGEDMLAAAVAKGMMMAPRPIVSVEEITSKQSRVETIERIARI